MTLSSPPLSEIEPLGDVARRLGLADHDFEWFGRNRAKIEPDLIRRSSAEEQTGKLVLVTGISPTPAGEGKTTTSIGLADGLAGLGRRTAVCLREPSMGPCFGQKGGATGSGRSRIVPADDINLHFTGDIHAVGAANNLLAVLIDNHLYWGNALDIDPERVVWRRAMDITDRALRDVLLYAKPQEEDPVHRGFDITAASEVMAILCLARSPEDLERRLSNVVAAYDRSGAPVTARDLGAHPAMTALLKDAVRPNLVQTLEGNPVLVHGGPFANIAHGCSSVIATRLGLSLADYTITEAGFGADLGAEKFFNIKCRQSGLRPDLAVLVATVRALKFHGGGADALAGPDAKAVQRGTQNLLQHVWRIGKFGVPVVVAINHFATDTREEVETVQRACETFGVPAVVSRHCSDGGDGAALLAQTVVDTLDRTPSKFRLLYPDGDSLLHKIETVAREIHGAGQVRLSDAAALQLESAEALGYGRLPICIAKSQYADPSGRDPQCLEVREIRLAAGAEYVVAICGQINTMPGLPRRPAALDFRLDRYGVVRGPGW